MRKISLLVLALLLCLATSAAADSHREAARELMRVSGTAQIMAQMQLQIESMFLDISSERDYSPKQQEIVARYRAEVAKLLREKMQWDQIENQVATLYMQTFSEAELKELIAFYQSDLGRKMITKMPEVMLRSAEIARGQMRFVIPRVKELGQQMSEELRATE